MMDFDTFEANSLVVDAVSYRFIVIGEAVNQIPPVIQSRASAISWKRMRDMRNIVAHNYRGVDTEIIWATIADDFDPLVQQLQALLDSDDPTPAT